MFPFTNDVETMSILNHKLRDKTGEYVLNQGMPRLLDLYDNKEWGVCEAVFSSPFFHPNKDVLAQWWYRRKWDSCSAG